MKTKIYDYAIFGAGVVGANIFNLLVRCGKDIVLLEKSTDVATGQSKANSALVHAGFDAKPNTLKAKLNVMGNKMFGEICQRIGISYKKTGAIVVDKTQDVLQKLYLRGVQNGVEELEIVSQPKLGQLVPNLKKEYRYGLWAKNAGIVSPYMFAIALCEEGIVNGGTVELCFDAQDISKQKTDNGIVYQILDKNGKAIFAKKIINCAGFGYNHIAKMLGEKQLPICFRKGEYFVLDKTASDFVGLSVFPAPSDMGKGILATPTIDGNILLGPTAIDGEFDTDTTIVGLQTIRNGIDSMFDKVPWNKVIRNYCGVRTIVGQDFVIELGSDKNIVNIAGICSPGLSASPAIAVYVCKLLGEDMTIVRNKKRTPYVAVAKLDTKAKDKLIKTNGDFGKIVCKCENVSQGEIICAINSPLKPCTIDGIKRRVRAGMGRCQGGFCALKVAQILSEQTKIPLQQILKEHRGSQIALQKLETGFFDGGQNGND